VGVAIAAALVAGALVLAAGSGRRAAPATPRVVWAGSVGTRSV
jgi:hypothetical protein